MSVALHLDSDVFRAHSVTISKYVRRADHSRRSVRCPIGLSVRYDYLGAAATSALGKGPLLFARVESARVSIFGRVGRVSSRLLRIHKTGEASLPSGCPFVVICADICARCQVRVV